MNPRFFLVMGVSGCGKTAVGQALAARLGWEFYDADDFHPAENIAKMANGIPLDDTDRAPWLASLHTLIAGRLEQNRSGVLACSALKERYRQTLLAGHPGVQLVFLKGSYALIFARMQARSEHYMQPQMLQSQLAALEEPADALTIDIGLSVDKIVNNIIATLGNPV